MKRLLYRDDEYFYKIFEDSWSAYVNRFIFRIFKKRKRTLFNWSGYERITEIKGSRDKVSDPENIEKAIEEYLEKDKPLLIKCSAEIGWKISYVESSGYVDDDEYWLVISCSKGDETKYFKFEGSYYSYGGTEIDDVLEVRQKEKTIKVWE